MALRKAYVAICQRDGVVPRLDLFSRVEDRLLSADLTLLEDPELRSLFSTIARYAYKHLSTLRLYCNQMKAYDRFKLELHNVQHANPLVLRSIASNRLAASVQQCLTPAECQIRWLELLGFRFTAAGLNTLSSALGANRSVIGLSLKDCAIGDEGLSVLMQGLRANCTIEQLQLSGCKLTNVGAVTIRSLITHHYTRRVGDDWNDGLKEVPMRKGRKSKPGAPEPAPRVVRGLTSIDLSANGIGDPGVVALCSHLRDDPYITAIDLRRNKLTERSRKEVAEAVRAGSHCGLKFADLRGNPGCDWALGLESWDSWGAAQAPGPEAFAGREEAAGLEGRASLRPARSTSSLRPSKSASSLATSAPELPGVRSMLALGGDAASTPRDSLPGSPLSTSTPPAAAAAAPALDPGLLSAVAALKAQLAEERLARAAAERRLAEALKPPPPLPPSKEDETLERIEATLRTLASAIERLEATSAPPAPPPPADPVPAAAAGVAERVRTLYGLSPDGRPDPAARKFHADPTPLDFDFEADSDGVAAPPGPLDAYAFELEDALRFTRRA